MPGWFKTDSQSRWILRCFGPPATRHDTAPAANTSPDGANMQPKTAETPAQEPAPAAETTAGTSSAHRGASDWPPELGSVAAALRVLVMSQHPDKGLYRDVSKVSRAGRDWTLQSAAGARLTLRPPQQGQPLGPWCAQLIAIRRDLIVRGELPTSVTVWCDRHTQGAAFDLIPALLEGAGVGVTELSLTPSAGCFGRGIRDADASVLTAFLQRCALAFPNLQSLAVAAELCVLPHPHHFPKLQQLALTIQPPADSPDASDHSDRALQALQQSLMLYAQHSPGHKAIVALPAAPPPTTSPLTSLTISHALTAVLLDLLLTHAPALKHLSAGKLQLPVSFADRVWGVERLNLQSITYEPVCALPKHCHPTVRQKWDGSWYRMLAAEWARAHDMRLKYSTNLGRLSMLPTHRQGAQVQVEWAERDLQLSIDETGGFGRGTKRLSDWCFMVDTVTVVPGPNQPATPGRQPPVLGHAALSKGLRRLKHVNAPGAALQLEWCHWIGHTQLLAQALAALPQFAIHMDAMDLTLTDEGLVAVLRGAPRTQKLSVRDVRLSPNVHTNRPVPWKELSVEMLRAVQVTSLPPPTAERPLLLRVGRFVVCQDVTRNNVAALCSWYEHALCAAPTDTEDLSVDIVPDTSHNIATEFALLRALRFADDNTAQRVKLTLRKALTQENIMALADLPQWSGCLDLTLCHWPLPAAAYQYLAAHVPRSFTEWRLPLVKDVPRNVCMGLNRHRAGLGLPPVRLVLREGYNETKEGEHVIILH